MAAVRTVTLSLPLAGRAGLGRQLSDSPGCAVKEADRRKGECQASVLFELLCGPWFTLPGESGLSVPVTVSVRIFSGPGFELDRQLDKLFCHS